MTFKARDALPWVMGAALVVLVVAAALQEPAKTPPPKQVPGPAIKPDPNRSLTREEVTALVRSLKEGPISEHPQARHMVVETLKKYKFMAIEILRAELAGDLPENKKLILRDAVTAIEE